MVTGCPMLSSSLHRPLGELLCDATEQILWPLASGRSRGKLHCRVGHGQATYHRYDPRQGLHQITYGVRMVEAKQQAESAAAWLSTREITRRRYFGGTVSPLNLLAHTCCHEFAHLLQQQDGKRYHGSVHNGHFYQILDNLHAQGQGNRVQGFLAEQAQRRGLPLSDQPLRLPDPTSARAQWRVGDKVFFGEGQSHRVGHILRVNRKTCTVACPALRGELRYRVPLSLLRREEAALTA
ncbi:hypothetical protein SAMN04487963_0792 [Marinobacter zhejiangensis]|uniref:SprT-like family protein n=2 Tax=Marinobacter zhejiangensis TaxID=488535 RepID=A0A1I4M1M9_9GAMM|nr:hypothetical protein SAMN04487963_0792 [Marinobacter zhejiangensis]